MFSAFTRMKTRVQFAQIWLTLKFTLHRCVQLPKADFLKCNSWHGNYLIRYARSAGEDGLGLRFADVLIKKYFCVFCQTNCLNIYPTDVHEICRIDRPLAADERSEVIFFDPSGTLPWQPIILWTKSTSNTQLVVRMAFARAALPAYNKKGNCYAGHRQTNKLPDSMDSGEPITWPINN